MPPITKPLAILIDGVTNQDSGYQRRSSDPERLGGGSEHLLFGVGEGHSSCPPCDLGMLLYEFYTIIMLLKATVITCCCC